MKSNKNTGFKISTLSAALMVVYGAPVFAEDAADLSQWIAPDSTVSVGAGFQNKDRPQLGRFDGRNDDNVKLMLDADVNKRDDATGTWNQLKLINFGLDNRELDLRHSRQGDYGVSFEYSRIPRESDLVFNTGLRYAGETQATKVVVPGTSPQNLQLGMHRDRYTFGANKIFDGILGGSLDLSVKYRQEEKDGRRNFGGYNGLPNPNGQAIFLVEPINSTTRQLDVVLNYIGKDLQLQGGYYGSWYDNSNSLLNVTTSALTKVYISLPPDNQAYQLYVNGAYAITPTTKTTFRVARTTATQDDNSLLKDIPSALLWSGFHGVKAKMVTTEGQAGITSNPIKDLTLLANAYYQDRDDRTPHIPYNNVAPTPDDTTPHSFRTTNLKLEGNYRVQPGFKLLGGIYYDVRERTIPFHAENTKAVTPTNAGGNWTVPVGVGNEREVPYRYETDELTFKAQATKNISDELNGSLTYAHSKRDGGNFRWDDQQNLINPIHMADRERDKVGVKLDWSPTDSLSFQAQFAQAKDDYTSNGLNGNTTAPNGYTLAGTGIIDGSAKLFSLDAEVKLNDSWQVTGWYSFDETKAKQYAFQAAFGPQPIRKTNLSDMGQSLGIGVKGKATADITLGADLEWNQSVGRYNQANVKDAGATMMEYLPNITNTTIRVGLNGAYQLDKKSSIRMDFVYDKWDTDDWSWMMWNNAKTALVPMAFARDGTSASVSSKQSASFVAVRYKYDF
jgi:MtrB/PioB family decaheme-associated outer membrane protein